VPSVPAEAVSVLAPARRRRSFAEVRRGFAARRDHDPVRAEASRCLSCGACTGCDECVVYCPEGVLARPGGVLPEVDLDYCKGCGLCVAACARGVLFTEAV
jgi:Pyruvate/2-oxoacid:ferredoxin oxidoreductase delta subunit